MTTKVPTLASEATLAEFLKNHAFPATFPNDGDFHRFSRRGGDDLNAFYCGKVYTVSGKQVTSVLIGEWGTPLYHLWQGGAEHLTPDEQAEFDRQKAATEESFRAAKAARQEQAASDCAFAWDQAITRGTTPYLERKKITRLHGARIHPGNVTSLLVPAGDIDGKLWSLQTIHAGGVKVFAKDGRKRGCFHDLTPGVPAESDIYVCEGFATAASVVEALGSGARVIAAFDAGNLAVTGAALRSRYGSARIVFCADDDRFGEPGNNPGLGSARLAATQCGGEVRTPHFLSLDDKPTDFNDLHVREGLDSVRASLSAEPRDPEPEPFVETNPGPGSVLQTLPRRPNAKGVLQRPFQQRVADALIHFYGDTLIKLSADDIFEYTGTHWELCLIREHDRFRREIAILAGADFESGALEGCYKLFIQRIPHVPTRIVDGDEQPINLFEPRRDAANFPNGTLHLMRRPRTREEMASFPGAGTEFLWTEFRPHSKLDYLTNVLPLEYRAETELPANEEFEAMLHSVWPDADHQAKANLYREILGAALIPEHPMMFFFVGLPKSGKSTLIMLVQKLLGGKNTGSVDPSLWGQRFALEPLLGKLANVDTDISTTGRIADAVAKKVIDGRVTVDRKNQTAVAARMPALHLFGANDMPETREGASGAYDRRAIIVRTTTPQAGFGGGGEFSDWIWGRGPEGVLKAALQGLARLLANGGKFTVPGSSADEMGEWKKDSFAAFFEAVEHREIVVGGRTLSLGESASISRSKLFAAFSEFENVSLPGQNRLSDKAFCKRMRHDSRFSERRVATGREWVGVGDLSNEDGSRY